MEAPIQSSKNPIVRRFRRAAAGEDEGRMVVEGLRLAAEVLASDLRVHEVAWSPRLTDRPEGEALLASLRDSAAVVHECTDRLLQQLSHLRTHQGLALILSRPSWTRADLLGPADATPLVVVAAGVRDPGNVGAILRAAEGAGATGLITHDAADPYRDKAARGSSGSVLRLPCAAGLSLDEILAFAADHGLQLLAAEGRGATTCWAVDFARPTMLVLGAEAAGLPDALRTADVTPVAVPLAEPVESLNVSVAAGVLLFEAKRQREAGREGPRGRGR